MTGQNFACASICKTLFNNHSLKKKLRSLTSNSWDKANDKSFSKKKNLDQQKQNHLPIAKKTKKQCLLSILPQIYSL